MQVQRVGSICLVMPAYAGLMPVDHDSPVPLYQQVAAELRARIKAESLARLPSLLSICQEYGVARPTAERAVKILIDAGEAYIVPGKGTFTGQPGKATGQ